MVKSSPRRDVSLPISLSRQRRTMSPEYDLFFLDNSQEMVWLGTAHSLKDALRIIHKRAIDKPGKFLVYSQTSGAKTIYDATPFGVVVEENLRAKGKCA